MRHNVLGTTASLILALVLTSAQAAWGASPSEMLEKAIYTEETVGNVDDAIKLYEQVIAEAKTARNAAAQAQYRLAQCLLKKNKPSEANAALEKLIKEYPEEKELVAKARKQLPGEIKLLPAPWQDHEALQLDLKLATGLDVGTYIYMIDSAKHDGKDAWRCTTRTFVALNKMEGYSTVLAEKESFAPISSRWMHSLLGDVDATYKPNTVELKDRRKNTAHEIDADGSMFDNEQGAELFRRLPLAVGYKKSIPLVTTLMGGKLSIEVEVPGKELVEVAAGKFECFKLVLNIGQTFYISADEHRYLVKFEAGGAAGELARVYQLTPGKSLQFAAREFTLTLPERWFAYAPRPIKEDDGETAFLLDTDGTASAMVTAKTLKAERQAKSLRERADADIEELKKTLKNFKLREPGVREHTVAGRPALTVVADYTAEGKPMVVRSTKVFQDKLEASFSVSIAADHFDAYIKQFDTVVESLQWK